MSSRRAEGCSEPRIDPDGEQSSARGGRDPREGAGEGAERGARLREREGGSLCASTMHVPKLLCRSRCEFPKEQFLCQFQWYYLVVVE